ncbi:MAG: hypothetical protein Q8N37_03910 [bacterium]|nr:hypothetical protein [bacterium]
MNKKTIALVLITAGMIFVPFLSNAAIPLTNPNNIFNTTVNFMDVVTRIANFIIAFIAILGIIFLVYGGLMYVTSAGDESRAEDGKKTITYALIGLLLAGMAYAIESLILITFVG